MLPIYSQLKKEIKDQGCYEDFIECLKLYDKDENGRMLVGELHHSLVALGKLLWCSNTCLEFNFGFLGEKLTDKEVDIVFDDCLDEENSDGEIEYDRKFRK